MRSVRYVSRHTAGITGTGHFGKFGKTSIPVPNTSVSSVRHRYRYGRLYRSWYRYRYNLDTGTGHFGEFGTSTCHIVTSNYGGFLRDPIASLLIYNFRSEKQIDFLLQSNSDVLRSNKIWYENQMAQVLRFWLPKSDDSAHRILKLKNNIGLKSRINVA